MISHISKSFSQIIAELTKIWWLFVCDVFPHRQINIVMVRNSFHISSSSNLRQILLVHVSTIKQSVLFYSSDNGSLVSINSRWGAMILHITLPVWITLVRWHYWWLSNLSHLLVYFSCLLVRSKVRNSMRIPWDYIKQITCSPTCRAYLANILSRNYLFLLNTFVSLSRGIGY